MMMRLFTTAFMTLAILALPLSGHAIAQDAKPAADDAVTLQQLLEQVRQGRVRDNSEFAAREAEFRKNRNQQKTLLTRTQNAIKREEARSERLEKTFADNEVKLAELEGLLNERLGAVSYTHLTLPTKA